MPGGAEQQQPALSGRSQGCRPPLQRRLGPARPAPSPARPGAGRLDGTRSCIVQRAEAQPSGFRAGGRLAKVVAKAFWAGMTRGKRTGGEQTAARSPMPAQPRGRRCTSSPAGKVRRCWGGTPPPSRSRTANSGVATQWGEPRSGRSATAQCHSAGHLGAVKRPDPALCGASGGAEAD